MERQPMREDGKGRREKVIVNLGTTSPRASATANILRSIRGPARTKGPKSTSPTGSAGSRKGTGRRSPSGSSVSLKKGRGSPRSSDGSESSILYRSKARSDPKSDLPVRKAVRGPVRATKAADPSGLGILPHIGKMKLKIRKSLVGVPDLTPTPKRLKMPSKKKSGQLEVKVEKPKLVKEKKEKTAGRSVSQFLFVRFGKYMTDAVFEFQRRLYNILATLLLCCVVFLLLCVTGLIPCYGTRTIRPTTDWGPGYLWIEGGEKEPWATRKPPWPHVVDNDCMECLCWTMTWCDPYYTWGGYFRMTHRYWVEGNRPTIEGESPDYELAYDHCIMDLKCSEMAVHAYMHKYGTDCDSDDWITCYDYFAIHVMGEWECDQLTDFWRMWFQRCLERYSRKKRDLVASDRNETEFVPLIGRRHKE